ncbi:MAG: RNA polymerase sigma factor FliA [Porticoccaceae bacterium]
MTVSEAMAYAQVQKSSLEKTLIEHLPLVKKIGLHLVGRLPAHIELDDLMQVGLLALSQAWENYDASQGASFATYASIRIKGAMLDEVRRSGWAPRSVQQKLKAVAQAVNHLEAQHGRAPSEAEIASAMGMQLDEYHLMSADLASCRMLSMDELDDVSVSGAGDPFCDLEGEGIRGALGAAITRLPEKERLMMSLYYGEELNLKEIGLVLGVSESRVSQLHGQALARIRADLVNWTA